MDAETLNLSLFLQINVFKSLNNNRQRNWRPFYQGTIFVYNAESFVYDGQTALLYLHFIQM